MALVQITVFRDLCFPGETPRALKVIVIHVERQLKGAGRDHHTVFVEVIALPGDGVVIGECKIVFGHPVFRHKIRHDLRKRPAIEAVGIRDLHRLREGLLLDGAGGRHGRQQQRPCKQSGRRAAQQFFQHSIPPRAACRKRARRCFRVFPMDYSACAWK